MANPATSDTGAFFKQDTFSDVTVKWGAQGEHTMKCHKVILSSRSEYFNTMLKPGSFKESEKGLVRLQEDDDDAVEAMLQYIYIFDYVISEAERMQTSFHRKVAVVANKSRAGQATTSPEILHVFENIHKLGQSGLADALKGWDKGFMKKHASNLLQNPKVRSLLENDVKMAMRFLDSLVFR